MTAEAFTNRFKNGVRKLQSFIREATELRKINKKTITVVFQFAKIEHYSTTFQLHFSEKKLYEN